MNRFKYLETLREWASNPEGKRGTKPKKFRIGRSKAKLKSRQKRVKKDRARRIHTKILQATRRTRNQNTRTGK